MMIHLVNGLIATALVTGSVVAWFGLPELIPVHFDMRGEPDRWVEASLLSWFGLPAAGLALAGGLYACARWLPSRPEWINLPDKERYLALPLDAREPVNDAVRDILHWSASFTLLLFGLLQVMVYREAHGMDARVLALAVLLVTLAAGPSLTVAALLRVRGAMDSAWHRHRARGGAPVTDGA